MVPGHAYHALLAVEGLKRGRSLARETGPISTVSAEHVKAVGPFVNPHVRAMIQIQELAAMRGQDVRVLRTCDLDRSRDIWVYTPWTHKTEHHGIVRKIALGPKAQSILAPFLKLDDPQAFVFNPRDAMKMLRAERRRGKVIAKSKVKMSKPLSTSKCRFRDQYTKDSYRNAVARGCKRANVPHWHPHQLRHNCATKIRQMFGLDAAAIVLGHSHGVTTEIYAEADFERAIEIMRQIG